MSDDTISIPVLSIRRIQNSKGDLLNVQECTVDKWALRLHRGNDKHAVMIFMESLDDNECTKLIKEFLLCDYSNFKETESDDKKITIGNIFSIIIGLIFSVSILAFFAFLVAYFMKIINI